MQAMDIFSRTSNISDLCQFLLTKTTKSKYLEQSYSWYQEGRTILDFNEAIDDGVAVTSAGPYADHLHFTPDR